MNDKCTCSPCETCKGRGTVFFGMDGKFLGAYQTDDTDDLETCEDCGGLGVDGVCEYCELLDAGEP